MFPKRKQDHIFSPHFKSVSGFNMSIGIFSYISFISNSPIWKTLHVKYMHPECT